MSTLIQFRVSGEDEADLLAAAKHAGMRPADYVRHCAKLAANRPDTVLQRIEERLTALEAKQTQQPLATHSSAIPGTLVKGMDATELVLAVRQETRTGFNAIITLLDGEPLSDIPHSRTPSGQSDYRVG